MAQIIKTKEYKAFKPIKGNRVINEYHVIQLTASITKHNLLEYFPILINENYEIVDGQHRWLVAKNNNLDLYYIMISGLTLEDARMLNAHLKPWTMEDYLDSYIKQGVKDYQILRDFCNDHDLPLGVAMVVLNNISTKEKTGQLRRDFKAGNFKATQLAYAQELVEKLNDIKAQLRPKIWRDRDFIFAFMRAEDKIDHNRLVEKASESGWTIERQYSLREYMRRLEDVYNYNAKTGRTRLF